MVDFGFTGTKKGMSDAQAARVEGILRAAGGGTFRHGMCRGADAQASFIAKRLGYTVIGYPGYGKDGVVNREGYADVQRDPKPFLGRNTDIARDCAVMIATPRQPKEIRFSGTWSTVRRGRNFKRGMMIVEPAGVVAVER